MLVMIKGAGDIASGIALRLWRAGINVVMTDLPKPSSIRRTVCFSEAVYRGETKVEEVRARLAANAADALRLLEENILPVIVDPKAESAKELHPDVIVDAILAKENLGTAITDAPGVVGVGPGFTAGTDCHAVVETMDNLESSESLTSTGSHYDKYTLLSSCNGFHCTVNRYTLLIS